MAARRGVYSIGLIPTQEINQSSRVGRENAPVLSVCQCSLSGLDTAYLLGLYGLSLYSPSSRVEKHPYPKSGR